MSKNLGWRVAVIFCLVILAFIYLVPSLSGELPQWWSSMLPQEKVKLGLDLQGGMHLILEVDVNKAIETDLERDTEDIKLDLREEKIRYLDIKRLGTEAIDINIMREEDGDAFKDMVKLRYPDYNVEEGPGKVEGLAFHLVLDSSAKGQVMKMALDQAVETIRNRIDQFGVTEPDIRPQEGHRILIQLPGVKDPERAKKLLKTAAHLEFKLVDEENSLEEALKGNIPSGREVLYEEVGNSEPGGKKSIPYLLHKRTSLTGDYISDARVQIDSQYNEPYVSLTFNSKGARVFERITGENVGKRLAIVLDNKVYSAPVIRDRIAGGKAQITGSFTMEEARDLTIVLRAGALPAPVKILEERTVGPSLGKDSIDKGFNSMMIGGAIVVLFMIIYYGFSGVIADLALLLNILFIMAGLAFFGATLTLPGIAGIVLTIGMAVDANVLVFERIREELRLGKTARAAIDTGYSKAIVTILDANITTLIAGLILFQFGTGPVRGFAVTLSIGIVSSVFTAVFVSKVVFDYLFIRRNWKKISI